MLMLSNTPESIPFHPISGLRSASTLVFGVCGALVFPAERCSAELARSPLPRRLGANGRSVMQERMSSHQLHSQHIRPLKKFITGGEEVVVECPRVFSLQLHL